MPQWLARLDHAFSPVRVEHAFLGRHKPFHFRVWYRDFINTYLRDVLLDPRSLSRPYLQAAMVEKIVLAHVSGYRNYTNELHKILSLELIHRMFVDVPGTLPPLSSAPRAMALQEICIS